MLLVVVEARVDGEVGQTDGIVLDRRQTETVHTVLAQVSHVPLTQPHQVHRVVFILTIKSITISITITNTQYTVHIPTNPYLSPLT